MGLLLFRVLKATWRIRGAWHLAVEQMMKIGVGSFPLVFVTAIFTGGVAAVQAAYQFQDYVPMRYLGTVVGKSVVIELGPVLTALVVGGRVSASISAELGTMKVTEQIDALETLAIDPVWFLMLPRLVAAIIMLPIATIFADILAIAGGYGVARVSLDLSSQTFMEGLRLLFHIRDVLGGLIKAFFFGSIIAGMGCFFGFRCEGGAEGVGRATTQAVVASCLLILITDYILASALFRILFR
jgi:phospholipid/cholesterol/gamma-HCH transport system permease protein